jgi:hypothetical protein
MHGADDVRADKAQGIGNTGPHSRLGRQVHHYLRFEPCHDLRHALTILEALDYGREPGALSEHGMPPLLQVHVVIVREPVESQHHVPLGEHPQREVETDETGRPGDQDFHATPASQGWGQSAATGPRPCQAAG